MPLTGFYIISAGVLIGFLAFLFALANMAGHTRSLVLGSGSQHDGYIFVKHIYAMGGLASGGLVIAVGVIVAISQAIGHYG